MSGGSYDYAYYKVEDVAAQLRGQADASPERLAFADLLSRVAKAMHDIEWVDSGDTSPGDELAAIRACIGPADTLNAATLKAETAMEALRRVLDSTPQEGKP